MRDEAEIQSELAQEWMELAERAEEYGETLRDALAAAEKRAAELEAKVGDLRKANTVLHGALADAMEHETEEQQRLAQSRAKGEAAGRRKGIEEAALIVEGGSFLHAEAPTAQFAREAAAAVRRALARVPDILPGDAGSKPVASGDSDTVKRTPKEPR